jgi:hypothetical protein
MQIKKCILHFGLMGIFHNLIELGLVLLPKRLGEGKYPDLFY